MRLKGRLKTIFDIIGGFQYEHIIDACCDHGHLGIYLAESYPSCRITLVDIIPSITEKLKRRTFRENVSVICMDAKNIELSDEKNLIFLCGIGGELAVKILQGVLGRHSYPSNLDFVIAVNNKSHLVRNFLKSKNYKSFNEKVVFDRSIGYEIIYSKFNSGVEFDVIGKSAFDLNNQKHLNLIRAKRDLYFLKAKYDQSKKEIYEAYDSFLDF